jgi:hypothetical protein
MAYRAGKPLGTVDTPVASAKTSAIWVKGTRLRRESSGGHYVSGVKLRDSASNAIDAEYHFGKFVIVGGNGETYSYVNQAEAEKMGGWVIDPRSRHAQ